MTNLKIAWAEVPEGPVWAKKIADKRWMLFEREADGRIHDYGLLMAETTIDPQDYPLWEFARAEQQPGEHAAELAEALRAGFAALTKEG